MTADLTVGFELTPPEQVIEDLVFEHLLDLVDLDRMKQLEMMVALKMGALGEAADQDQLHERSAAILVRAWHRLILDPRRYLDFTGRWEPDEECELCRMLAETA
ncbi:MAG: hypothetical protein WKG01_02340 [Kofleriaceae bacterium]